MKRTQIMQGTETPPLPDSFTASQVRPHIYMMQPFINLFLCTCQMESPNLMLLLDRFGYIRRPNGAPINPTCGHTLCLGSQNRISGPRAVFNETTHCVLLHSLSSFTFV